MKKIMILIFFALALVSCGVNALNPEKLELQKEPINDAPVTSYINTVSLSDLNGRQDSTVAYHKRIGISAATIENNGTPTGVAIAVNSQGKKFTTEANIAYNAANNTYTISLLEVNTNEYAAANIYIQFSKNTTIANVDFDQLAITKPTREFTTSDTAQEPILVPDYKAVGTGTPPLAKDSHIAYIATAPKGSDIFSKITDTDIANITVDGTGGKIDIPALPSGSLDIGTKVRVWVVEQYQQQ